MHIKSNPIKVLLAVPAAMIAMAVLSVAGSVAPVGAGGYHAPSVQLNDTADGVTHSDGSAVTSPALTNANGSEKYFGNFGPDRHDKRAFGSMIVTSATLDVVSGNITNACVVAMATPFVPATRHTPAQLPYIGTPIWSSDNANGCFHLVHGHNHIGITSIFAGLTYAQVGTVTLMVYSDANHVNKDANLVIWTGATDNDRLAPVISATLGDSSGDKG